MRKLILNFILLSLVSFNNLLASPLHYNKISQPASSGAEDLDSHANSIGVDPAAEQNLQDLDRSYKTTIHSTRQHASSKFLESKKIYAEQHLHKIKKTGEYTSSSFKIKTKQGLGFTRGSMRVHGLEDSKGLDSPLFKDVMSWSLNFELKANDKLSLFAFTGIDSFFYNAAGMDKLFTALRVAKENIGNFFYVWNIGGGVIYNFRPQSSIDPFISAGAGSGIAVHQSKMLNFYNPRIFFIEAGVNFRFSDIADIGFSIQENLDYRLEGISTRRSNSKRAKYEMKDMGPRKFMLNITLNF